MKPELLVALVLLCVPLSGCTGQEVQRACTVSEQGGAPVIGALIPRSGDLGPVGGDVARAIDLAVRDVNLAGGVMDRELRVEEADTGSQPGGGQEAAQRLVGLGVGAVVGPVGSAVALEASATFRAEGVVMVTPASTPALTGPSSQGWVFRTVAPDGFQGWALSKLLSDQRAGRVVLMHLDATYGRAIAGTLAQTASTGGSWSLVDTIPIDPDGTDHRQEIQRAKDADPDSLVYLGFPKQGTELLTQAHEAGLLEERGIFFTEGVMSRAFVHQVANRTGEPGVLSGARGVAPSAFVAGAVSGSFDDRFTEAYGHEPGLFAAEAYDAVIALALTMEATQSAQGGDLAPCLPIVWNAPGRSVTDQDLQDGLAAARAGQDLDHRPVSGVGDWNATGDPIEARYVTWEVTDQATIEVIDRDLTVSAGGGR